MPCLHKINTQHHFVTSTLKAYWRPRQTNGYWSSSLRCNVRPLKGLSLSMVLDYIHLCIKWFFSVSSKKLITQKPAHTHFLPSCAKLLHSRFKATHLLLWHKGSAPPPPKPLSQSPSPFSNVIFPPVRQRPAGYHTGRLNICTGLSCM